jgi:hypothetical protein
VTRVVVVLFLPHGNPGREQIVSRYYFLYRDHLLQEIYVYTHTHGNPGREQIVSEMESVSL